MLKLSIVVAAALLGTTAIAQDASSPSNAMPGDSAPAMPATTENAAAASPDAGMTQDAGTATATPDMSAPASASAGATRTYPRCSRTVTDSCIQGGARARRR